MSSTQKATQSFENKWSKHARETPSWRTKMQCVKDVDLGQALFLAHKRAPTNRVEHLRLRWCRAYNPHCEVVKL